jgi:hypothetical protein
MEAWMRNAKLETENARRYRQSNVSTAFETMLNIRTISIGMYPTFHLIEMTEGVELPEGFHHHPVVVEMKRVASRLVSFGNDLGGLAKDIAGDWPNLVTTLQAELQVSIEDAFRVIVDMHNADIEVFDELEQHLPTYDPDVDLQIRGWVQAVRYSVLGFTLWESLAERYQAVKPVIRDKVLAAPVTFLQPS